MLVIAYVFTSSPLPAHVLPLYAIVPYTLPVNKIRLVFTNLYFYFDYFDLFSCYDCVGPSLPLDTYPKFTVVITEAMDLIDLLWSLSIMASVLLKNPGVIFLYEQS